MTDSRDEAEPGSAPASETAVAANENQAAADKAPEVEIAELKDRLLRTLAEMENLRRRTEREITDARTYGIAAFARDVLGVADNMRRALEAVDAAHRETADAGYRALIDGIELTERDLLKSLEKHGITKVEPQGQRFDPNFHQAMFELPDPSVPAGTVVQVVQIGYKIGERVLRPALVGVAKGGPKVQAPSASDESSVEGGAGTK